MDCLLGIDLGTTAIKIGLFDSKGKTLSVSTYEYELYAPSAEILELDAEVYWDTFKKGLFDVLAESKINKEDLKAISISAQSETLVITDEKGKALRNAIVWMDTRAQKEAAFLGEKFSKSEINKVTGQTEMMAIWPCAKVLWIKKNEPDVFKKAKKYLLLEDYFIHRLNGGWYGEGSLWSSSVMWDISKKVYWEEMLNAIGINEDQLPKILNSGVDVGELLPSVANELGLSTKTRVVTGGLDGALGAMGVGNVTTGIFSESGGSSLTACLFVDKPFFDKNLEMPCFYSPIDGTYLICAFSSGAICYRWARDKFCQNEMEVEKMGGPNAYYLMDKEAEKIPEGCDGLTILPHFLGAGMPDTDSYAKCTFTGLTLHHTKAHIIRGFMESVACVLRRMIMSLESSNVSVKEILSMGGAANSKLWCQIKSDMTQKKLVTTMNTDNSACIGAALLAGVGIGLWKSVKEGYKVFQAPIDNEYKPNKKNEKPYNELYERYVLLMKTLKPINSKI